MTILEYVGSGAGRAGQIVEGAVDEADALAKLKENPNRFQRPVVGFPIAHHSVPTSGVRLFGSMLIRWDRSWIGTMEELVKSNGPRPIETKLMHD